MTALIVHGHFYQPPRENPWTGALDREESAHPYHDWNERIFAECYRPNAFARIFDGSGRIERIVNNYANISFNFGPTLMHWLAASHPRAYTRIIEADRISVRRHHGHGNAIAQGYNHAILPLCNERDRLTQVLWGIGDFRHRFGREPEALWMPETACNDATLATLIEAGLRFAILSPHQAERVRPLKGGEWRVVSNGSIDPRRPYRYFHRDGSGRSIVLFFYDDPMARAIAFEGALTSSRNLLERLTMARGEEGPLVNVATDGESYGHHFHFGDRCLAYALEVEAAGHGFEVTNYGDFLENHSPQDEVEIKAGPDGEGTAWSCAHGVGRWYRDCGCSTGAQEGWNQAWRGPLRRAFDLLRDRSAEYFEEAGADLFRDPWAARDQYIDLLVNPSARREEFLERRAGRRLHDAEMVRALNLLELQRAAMLMYTSCGWFFADVSGIETVQVMKYAGRALDLIEELDLELPRDEFLDALAEAKSNIPLMGNGADVYRRFVTPCRTTPRRIAAHLAISGLANYGAEHGAIGDYEFHKSNYQQRQHGRLTLATCRLLVRAHTTGHERDFAAAALHIGGMDFYCTLSPYPGSIRFRRAADSLWERFHGASLPLLLRLMREQFGPDEFGLEDVLADGRWAISGMVFGYLSEDLTAEFVRLYEQDRRSIEMLHESGFELPAELRLLSEFTLGRRLEQAILEQNGNLDPVGYDLAAAIADEIERYRYNVDKSSADRHFSEMIAAASDEAAANPTPENTRRALDAIAIAKRLRLAPNLDSAQEAIYDAIMSNGATAEALATLASKLGLSPEVYSKLAHGPEKRPPIVLVTAHGS
jgi:alpha-amylase/alpha-mannosidase (GH57 family)